MKSSYKTLYLIDISSFIFRAFYAIRELSAPDGTPVNAVYGVASMLGRLMDEVEPQYLAVLYDSKEPSFRKEMYPEYKANRSEVPELLIPQFALIEELIKHMGIPSFRQSGVEADDLIASLNKKWIEVDPSHRTVVVTGDKDLMALVTAKTQLWDTMKDVHYTPHEVIEKFGVKPSQITEYLAIVGDASDNIPGITGIGPKGAEQLLKDFESLEGVIAAAKAGKIKGKKSEMIIEYEPAARLSLTLATLKEDLELKCSLEDARFDFRVRTPLLDFCQRYNLRSLHTKYAKIGANEGVPTFDLESTPQLSESARDESSPGETGAPSLEKAERPPQKHTPALSDEEEKVFKKYVPIFRTVSTHQELDSLIAEIKIKKRFGFDTETTSLDPKKAALVGIAIALDTESGYYIPVGHTRLLDSTFDQLDLDEVIAKLKPILESTEYKKIGQNLKYDVRVMFNQGVMLTGIEGDTMVAAYTLDSSGRHNLDFLAKKYLGYQVVNFEEVVGKGASEISFADVPIEKATLYSAEDAWCAFTLWETLRQKLKEAGVEKLFYDVDLPIVEVVAEMEEAGIKVDVPFLKKLEIQFDVELKDLEKKILTFTKNQSINLNSPKQLGGFLFEELKLPTQGKTKTGFSTDASVLAILAELHEAPKLILEYREIAKLKNTYVLPLQEIRSLKDSRIRTNFHLTGTATGRLSSSDPNLQNIPTRTKRGQLIREAFIAEEGKVFLSADYSQIELRILAHLSEDPHLISSFTTGEDVHRRTAGEIFHLDPAKVTDEQRSYAKAINFGLMYGKSAFGLAEELRISRTDAKKMIDAYFTRYSKVKHFLDDQIVRAREEGYITTLLGRKRELPEIKSSNGMMRANAERMAMNSPIQGTASDMIKVAMVKLVHTLKQKKLQSKLLLQVHDELVLECPKAELEVVQKLVVEIMEGAIKLKVPLQVNVNTGKNWAEL